MSDRITPTEVGSTAHSTLQTKLANLDDVLIPPKQTFKRSDDENTRCLAFGANTPRKFVVLTRGLDARATGVLLDQTSMFYFVGHL